MLRAHVDELGAGFHQLVGFGREHGAGVAQAELFPSFLRRFLDLVHCTSDVHSKHPCPYSVRPG
jgi:hypothetical protein